jgi:hypothetical protein
MRKHQAVAGHEQVYHARDELSREAKRRSGAAITYPSLRTLAERKGPLTLVEWYSSTPHGKMRER